MLTFVERFNNKLPLNFMAKVKQIKIMLHDLSNATTSSEEPKTNIPRKGNNNFICSIFCPINFNLLNARVALI